jgi:CRISPR-associated DxTHG motif protein
MADESKKVLLTFIGDTSKYREVEYEFRGNKLTFGKFYVFELSRKLGISDIVIFKNSSLGLDKLCDLFEEEIEESDECYDLTDGEDINEMEKYLNQKIKGMRIKLVEIDDKNLEKSFKVIEQTIRQILKGVRFSEINLDITHSYRHIPIFTLIVLDMLSIKIKSKILLKNIIYVVERNDSYEILELKDYITFMNFTKALKNFINYGNLYDFSQELKNFSKEQKVEEYAQLLEETDFYLNFSLLDELQECFNKLNNNLNNNLSSIKKVLQKPPFNYIYEDFVNFIRNFKKKKISEFQFELAKYYRKWNRYALEVIALREALISKYIEEYIEEYEDEKKVTNRDERERVENPLQDTPYSFFWKIISDLRNIPAHLLGRGEGQKAVDYFRKNKKRYEEFLRTLSPKKLGDNFPKKIDEIFNSIKK